MKNLKYMAVAALLACGALNASAKDNVEYVTHSSEQLTSASATRVRYVRTD